MEILFLNLQEVLEIHNQQIAHYGGEPSIRDLGLLESALATPQVMFGGEYLHSFPAEMAAAYLFHLVANHPFVDGNKRTGLAAALTFLDMNDHDLQAAKPDVEQLVLDVAAGKLDKTDVVVFFKRHVITSTPPAPTSE